MFGLAYKPNVGMSSSNETKKIGANEQHNDSIPQT